MLRQIVDVLQSSTNTAFVINDQHYSYSDLNTLVKRYYSYLIKLDAKIIGIVMHNDLDTYAFITASLLSDCGYVILNLSSPLDRNTAIVQDAGLKIVASSIPADIGSVPMDLSFVDMNTIPAPEGQVVYGEPEPQSIAYIVFTSGSTGNPKGVKITKRNLQAFLTSFFGTDFPILTHDHVLQMFDLTFDASILMLVPSLCVGATIYTTDSTRIKLIEIARVLTSYPLTYVFLVPSVVTLLRQYMSAMVLPTVKTMLIGAEPVTMTMLDLLRPSIPNSEVWCIYGPTETTVIVSAHKIVEATRQELYNDIVPIGKAMPGVKHILLGDDGPVSETGVKGELLIGGDQVTEGYINDEYKNEHSFHWLEYQGSSERFYASGDIVLLNEYGDYAYCERKDHQVKIQGLRIELSEIEFHASQVTNGRTVALAKEIDGNQQLFLFLEDYHGHNEEVSRFLESKLPPYMVPRNIKNLERFPLNVNDKIDRIQLEELITGI